MENVEESTEADVLCTIHGETFQLFTKNTWIDDSGNSCHITNNDTGLYDITSINKFVNGSVSNMTTTKKD